VFGLISRGLGQRDCKILDISLRQIDYTGNLHLSIKPFCYIFDANYFPLRKIEALFYCHLEMPNFGIYRGKSAKFNRFQRHFFISKLHLLTHKLNLQQKNPFFAAICEILNVF